LKRKQFMMATLIALVLLIVALVPLSGQESGSYDPWRDLNDDGINDVNDLYILASIYGTSGTPLNKTALLLELQSKVDSLNQTLETRIPKKGYISVPACAFVPSNSSQRVIYPWHALYNYESTGVICYGSVQLPHEATVTNVTFYWYDSGAYSMMFELLRYNQTHNPQTMAWTTSPGEPGNGYSYDDTIAYATVDNSRYAYYLEVSIPNSTSHTDYYFRYAIIEYEYPT